MADLIWIRDRAAEYVHKAAREHNGGLDGADYAVLWRSAEKDVDRLYEQVKVIYKLRSRITGYKKQIRHMQAKLELYRAKQR